MGLITLKFKTPSLLITKSGRYKADGGTIIFQNIGTTTATIDYHWKIYPGASMSIDAPPIGGLVDKQGQPVFVVQLNIHEYQVVFDGGSNEGALVMIYQVYQ